MTGDKLRFSILENRFAVCRLDEYSTFPDWINTGEFLSITKTVDELSIVCTQNQIPDTVKCVKDWRILKVEETLDFSLIGILADISNTLAEAGISIFALSTYDTDYILVKEEHLNNTVTALSSQGHYFVKID